MASPLYLGNGEIAVFGSYGAGSARIKISRMIQVIRQSVAEQHKATNGIASEQHTPIMMDDYIWLMLPRMPAT